MLSDIHPICRMLYPFAFIISLILWRITLPVGLSVFGRVGNEGGGSEGWRLTILFGTIPLILEAS